MWVTKTRREWYNEIESFKRRQKVNNRGQDTWLTAAEQMVLVDELNQMGIAEVLRKQPWKECHWCGIVTDFNEKVCPCRCGKGNPEDGLRIVWLDGEELRQLQKKGRLWTKYAAETERRLSPMR